MNICVGLIIPCLILTSGLADAATQAPWQAAPTVQIKDKAKPTFPAILEAARVKPVENDPVGTPTRATLAVELFLVLGISASLARVLPRNRRRRRRVHPVWAAREMSWMRCTIARNPFER